VPVTAVIGVLGVLLGAVAAGFSSYALQKRRESLLASSAMRAVREQFSEVVADLQGVQKDKNWRPRSAQIASSAWQAHGASLVGVLSPDEWAKAYRLVSTLERIDDAMTRLPDDDQSRRPVMPPELFEEAEQSRRDAETFRENLDAWTTESHRWWAWAVAAPLAVIAALAVAGVVYTVIGGEPSLTASSLAKSLKDHRPGADLTSCRRRPLFGSVWECTVTYRDPPGCKVANASSATRVLMDTSAGVLTRDGSCGERAEEDEVIADSSSNCWVAADASKDIQRMRNQPLPTRPVPPLLLRLFRGAVSVVRGCL